MMDISTRSDRWMKRFKMKYFWRLGSNFDIDKIEFLAQRFRCDHKRAFGPNYFEIDFFHTLSQRN